MVFIIIFLNPKGFNFLFCYSPNKTNIDLLWCQVGNRESSHDQDRLENAHGRRGLELGVLRHFGLR
jgi:hypothetical protein